MFAQEEKGGTGVVGVHVMGGGEARGCWGRSPTSSPSSPTWPLGAPFSRCCCLPQLLPIHCARLGQRHTTTPQPLVTFLLKPGSSLSFGTSHIGSHLTVLDWYTINLECITPSHHRHCLIFYHFKGVLWCTNVLIVQLN